MTKHNHLDLHMHSCYSEDGEYTPSELVRMCADAGIKTMAIADHNCVKANKEAAKKALALGIEYYPAVEIDCSYHDMDLHVLGYHICSKSSDFDFIEENIRMQCEKASRERLRLVRKMGFQILEEELHAVTKDSYWPESWSGEVFAEVLLGKEEYKEHELLRPYRTGGVRGDAPYVNFYWDYFSKGKVCHAHMKYPDIRDILDIIHKNNGEAVLAHPGKNLSGRYEVLDEFIAFGLDGVEAFSSYHDKETAQWFYEKAKRHHLKVTGGSDFHGKTKPEVCLGEYCKG